MTWVCSISVVYIGVAVADGVLLRPSIDWETNDLSSRYVSFVNVRMDLMKQMFDSSYLTIPDYKLLKKLTKRNAYRDTEDV